MTTDRALMTHLLFSLFGRGQQHHFRSLSSPPAFRPHSIGFFFFSFKIPRVVVDLQQLISYSSKQAMVPVHVLTMHGKTRRLGQSMDSVPQRHRESNVVARRHVLAGIHASSAPLGIVRGVLTTATNTGFNLTSTVDGVSWARQSIRPLPDTQHHDFSFPCRGHIHQNNCFWSI
jgi:hypothetical protein